MTMHPEGPFCQSCGMPMSADPEGGGTESDGRRNAVYCSHCYQAGEFTQPDLTAEQMMARVRSRLQAKGMPLSAVASVVGQIPLLRRWR